MNWLQPSTVRGWFVLIVLGALLLSQLISLALLVSQQSILRSAMHEAEALIRTEGLYSLAKNADEKTLKDIQLTATSPTFIVSFDNHPVIAAGKNNAALARSLAERIAVGSNQVRIAWDASKAFALTTVIRHQAGDKAIIIRRTTKDMAEITLSPTPPAPPPVPPVPPVPPLPPAPPKSPSMEWEKIGPVIQHVDLEPHMQSIEAETISGIPERLDIAIALKPSLWLNVSAVPTESPSMVVPLVLAGLCAALLLAIAAIWAAGRVARPIAGLTHAANKLGKGDVLVLAPEEGPLDVRAAAKAFNTMATRLRRLIDDQRALLNAVGHDLRTPIASLRIRTELVKDPELQAKMLVSLEEMQRLTEATLTAARGGETNELTRPVDLRSLIEAVCDDISDMGKPVTAIDLKAARTDGRASELRRALRNLIENAIRYGRQASVTMSIAAAMVEIYVDDEGPGIPETAFEQVFKPFVRLEESRNNETGGYGLGLTIARAIAERHGGEITLKNRPEGGLRATLRLPASAG